MNASNIDELVSEVRGQQNKEKFKKNKTAEDEIKLDINILNLVNWTGIIKKDSFGYKLYKWWNEIE